MTFDFNKIEIGHTLFESMQLVAAFGKDIIVNQIHPESKFDIYDAEKHLAGMMLSLLIVFSSLLVLFIFKRIKK